ncbi:MAG: MFS transporter [Spirochaetia bacterium]|nr:MFS transporter [Spirochaetia bacterium]
MVKNSEPGKKISLPAIIFYSLPMAGGGAMNMLIALYLMKYSTDALFIAPAIMGLLFFVSKTWDAINDPIFGYLSDHTRSRFGRRKIWILGSAIPLGVFFYLLWMPSERFIVLWMAVSLIAFYTFFTTLYVPHYSLGAELSPDYNERHRIYGARAIAENFGIFAAVGVMQLIPDTASARLNVPWLMFIVAAVSVVLIFSMHFFVNENGAYQPESTSFIESTLGVFRNPHARLILIAGFFGQLGAAIIFGMTLYFAEYVMQASSSGNFVIGLFIVCASFTVPVWIFLLKRFEKKTIWIMANIILGICFATTYTLGKEDLNTLYLISIFAGSASGSILFIHPSALADAVDYEELMSGKKSQGMYFSIFTFVNKSSMAVAAMITGAMLSVGGFQPNIIQTESALFYIRITYAFFPLAAFIVAAILLTYYSLNKEEHSRIREAIQNKQ